MYYQFYHLTKMKRLTLQVYKDYGGLRKTTVVFSEISQFVELNHRSLCSVVYFFPILYNLPLSVTAYNAPSVPCVISRKR